MKLLSVLLLLSGNVYSNELFKPLFSNNCTTQEITKILPENLTDRVNTIHLAIDRIASELEVNPCLILSIVWIESTFKPSQRSYKGAEGLMQLMSKTKSAMRLSMGYKLNTIVTSNLASKLSYRELENIAIGTYYVKKLIKKFKGNTKYAIIAYNQGPTRTMSQLNKGIISHKNIYLSKVNSNLVLVTVNN